MTRSLTSEDTCIDTQLDQLNQIRRRVQRIIKASRFFKALEGITTQSESNQLAQCGQLLNIILHELKMQQKAILNLLHVWETCPETSQLEKEACDMTAFSHSPQSLRDEIRRLTLVWKGSLSQHQHDIATIDQVVENPELIPLSYLHRLAQKYCISREQPLRRRNSYRWTHDAPCNVTSV